MFSMSTFNFLSFDSEINATHDVGLKNCRAVLLNGGHLLARFGQVGDKARQSIY